MTIELGFGWMTLPNGEEVGIVDVPGHRDFIENMLSGIGGIDAALLIVAADEGVMPQTREHLAILDLLQIPAGLIVLTKTDLASDSAWLDLVSQDIRSAVKNTILKDAPIIRVSAKSKIGLDDLISSLQSLLQEKPARPDLNRPRLPIDRVFSMSGFGTVVTGTLRDGRLAVGDDVEILPGGITGRIRGLQSHREKEETAIPGSRTAVNISGLDVEQVRRGDVLVHSGQYHATRRIDARFKALKDIQKPLLHGDEVKFFTGASETMAVIRLLGIEDIKGDEEGWIQIELRDPVVALRGDRYILRRPSPGETLGGGSVVDHQPKGRHKRLDVNIIKSLDALLQGTPDEILLESALALGVAPIKDIIARSRLESLHAESALSELIETEKLIVLGEKGKRTPETLAVPASQWKTIHENTIRLVGEYHSQYPLRRGIPREELKSKTNLAPKIFNAALMLLATQGLILDERGAVSMPGHKIKFTGADQAKVEALRRRFEANPFSTPSIKECQAEAGVEVLNALIEMEELIPVSQEVIFRKSDYAGMVDQIELLIKKQGQITLAETRDMFNTTRKYAQGILEHMDSIGKTLRNGDVRILRK
jgi:selenocysteine-specific elongation factor